MKIGLLNYGLGNIGSVLSALHFLKKEPVIIDSATDIKKVDTIIVSGVGNFGYAMPLLAKGGHIEELETFVFQRGKPYLGICLGMQLMADFSEESGTKVKGLNWIPGQVKQLLPANDKIPHMGWETLKTNNSNLFRNGLNGPFYFMHSFHFEPKDQAVISSWANHGQMEFVASVQKDNIFGVQFHPEKSQGDGIRLINNFLEIAREV